MYLHRTSIHFTFAHGLPHMLYMTFKFFVDFCPNLLPIYILVPPLASI